MPTARKPKPPSEDEFVYTAPNGGTIALPALKRALNAKEMRHHRNDNPLQILYFVIERDNPKGLDALDAVLETMSLDEDVPDLIRKWQDHSGMSLGESSTS